MMAEEKYRAASMEADRRKAAFLSTVASTKARLSPSRLKHEAKDKVSARLRGTRDQAAAKVNEHPVAAGAAVGAFILYLFRRPLSAFFRRTYVRLTNHTPDQSEKDDG